MSSLRPALVLRLALKQFFEVLVLAKAVLVLTLDGLKDLKNCGLKIKNVLRPFLERHQNNVTNFFPIWALLNQNFWLGQWSWVNNLMIFKKSGLGREKIGLGLEKIGGLGFGLVT